jgi:polyprenyldihydroxybenzoate methyltransferase / 3-demethylubiquinol 3-O-methyltransferase
MNPTRHDFIASCLAESEPRPASGDPNHGLRYLDIGCGGGIFAESLARTVRSRKSPAAGLHPRTKAASIVAIDPSTSLIKIAQDHARMDPTVFEHLQSGAFRYENTTVESLSSAATTPDNKFDVVTLFEVIEHVDPQTSSPMEFLTHCLKLLNPGGWLIGSTIARTIPSFIVNKMVAEAPWPIGVVPWGTHEWSKFVNADELQGWVEEGLMRAADGPAQRAGSEALRGTKWKIAGAVYVPGWGWKMVDGGEDWGNYFWAVQKGV